MKNASENNSHALPDPSYSAITRRITPDDDPTLDAPETVLIKFDGDAEEISMGRVDEDGETIDERGSMALRRVDLDGHKMEIKEVSFCVDGTPMLARMPKTENYPVT